MANNSKAFVAEHKGGFKCLREYNEPRDSYKKTESLVKVLKLVKDRKVSVTHIYGMSGSGKSQVVAAVCKDLDASHQDQIIWRVECDPAGGKLKDECRKFACRLLAKGIITHETEAAMQRAFDEGEQSDMKKFIDEINKLQIPPILLVIEDIEDEDEKRVVKTLVNCMKEGHSYDVLNLKLLIATQDKEVLFAEIDLRVLAEKSFYETYKVAGFSPTEALEFLQYRGLEITDEAKVAELARELAYSPLGLVMAKSHCVKNSITYEEYWDGLGKDEHEEKEKELLKNHPDLGKYHRYEVIMKLLEPTSNDNEEKIIQFKVMKMLSFLGNQKIPSQLLDKFFKQIISPDIFKQFGVKYLLARLRDEVDAVVEGDSDLLTLHADILRALNASMKPDEKREVLGNVVFAIASLLDKDNRAKPQYALLHSLKNHAETVARHCADHFSDLLDGEIQLGDFEIILGLSKLNELIGFSMSQHQGFRKGYEEDDFYQRAIDCIWVIVQARSEKSFLSLSWLPSWLTGKDKKREKSKHLVNFDSGKDTRKTAKEIFEKVKEASVGKAKIKEALRHDWERLYPVKETHLADMKTRVGENKTLDWDKIRREILKNGRLSEKFTKQLVDASLVVEWEKLVKYYLTERLASILHSRGRLDNYKLDIIPPEMRVSCVWYAELGYQLCDVAFEKTGIKSIFHYILKANNKLPRKVKTKEGESDEEFRERILESLQIARSVQAERSDFYEHGIYKRVSGTPWTLMNALKYIVKANTKVRAKPEVAKTFSTPVADKECKELTEICLKNTDIIMAASCLVHAGKYMAATGEFIKALQTFESAFEAGISKRSEKNPPTYCWALHNMGRAIVGGGKGLQDKEVYVAKFNDRYIVTKRIETPAKWRDLLDRIKKDIDCSQ